MLWYYGICSIAGGISRGVVLGEFGFVGVNTAHTPETGGQLLPLRNEIFFHVISHYFPKNSRSQNCVGHIRIPAQELMDITCLKMEDDLENIKASTAGNIVLAVGGHNLGTASLEQPGGPAC